MSQTRQRKPNRPRRSPAARGWLPNQHGAWAMLTVPFVVGVVLRSRSGEPLEAWLVPLAVAELSAYLAFNALGLWLHAAPARRDCFRKPITAYGLLTAVSAALVIVLGGGRLLWWLPLAAPLIAWAIWQASRKQDRSVTSGLATITLAVGMGLAVRFPDPRELLGLSSDIAPVLAIFAALLAYFAGTVWYVKSLIREWGNPQARRQAIGWYAVFTMLTLVAAAVRLLNPGWPVFFAICTLRAWWFSAPRRGHRPKPAQIGFLEIAMSLVALVIALV